MIIRRRLLLAILLYVSLDLSLASMPGAFVFEVQDSVESAQMSRLRPTADVATALATAPGPKALVVQADVKRRPAPAAVRPMPIRGRDAAPAVTLDPPAPSEDPH